MFDLPAIQIISLLQYIALCANAVMRRMRHNIIKSFYFLLIHMPFGVSHCQKICVCISCIMAYYSCFDKIHKILFVGAFNITQIRNNFLFIVVCNRCARKLPETSFGGCTYWTPWNAKSLLNKKKNLQNLVESMILLGQWKQWQTLK